MGLSDVDSNTGVGFKVRKQSKKQKIIDEVTSGLVIEKSKPKEEVLVCDNTSLVDVLTSMKEEENLTYKALINSELYDYDFATDTSDKEVPYEAYCIGTGVVVLSNFNIDTVDGDVVPPNSKILYFWKKGKLPDELADVNSNGSLVDSDFEGDEINTYISESRNPELNDEDGLSIADIKTILDVIDNDVDGGQDDLTNEVKQNEEEDLTMATKNYENANKVLETLKESGDAGVDVLINYCKISFAEVFTKTVGGGSETLVTELQDQMTYIISEINKNDLLTPESKAKLTKAIEDESAEYKKLLESMTDVTDETKELLKTKESDDMSWGEIALYALGAVIIIGGAYSLYRYFEPEDVVLDMSTMSIMNR
jgi:hypothetical protein